MAGGRVCVIFNPTAGRRRAARRLSTFRRNWESHADFWPTDSAGHARKLAQNAVKQGYRTIAAAGGDGTVHEVAGGILAAGDKESTLAVVPIGSANDYAYSLRQQFGWSTLDDGAGHPVDVGLIRHSQREEYFVESLGLGLSAEVTAQSRRIPHRQGLWLYGSAALAVLRERRPPLDLRLRWDDELPVAQPTRLLSVLLGQREGNFLMARQARLDDGLFNVVHGGDVSHWEALRLLPRFLLGGPPTGHPRVSLRTCRRLQVAASEPLTVHADGELILVPEAGVRQIDLKVLPARLRAKVCRL